MRYNNFEQITLDRSLSNDEIQRYLFRLVEELNYKVPDTNDADATQEETQSVEIDFDAIYPVGSIYMSVNSTSPAVLFGGTWEHISQGRALFGAGTLNNITYTAGDTVNAGLPNISGDMGLTYSDYNLGNTSYGDYVTGAFKYREISGTNQNLSSGSYDAQRVVSMDAHQQNSIYGNSTTVQPNAFVVYVWKRTA